MVLFGVTLLTICLPESHPYYNSILSKLLMYSYFIFGPLLLLSCLAGLIIYKRALLYQCDPNKGTDGTKGVNY